MVMMGWIGTYLSIEITSRTGCWIGKQAMESKTNHKQQVQEQYSDSNKLDLRNEIQEKYRTRGTPWFRWVFNHLNLPENCRILELGGGSGMLWEENRERIPPRWQITVTDLSRGILRAARERVGDEVTARHFLALDGQHLPFPGGQFDCVLAIGVLDAVPDLNQALSEVWQVLRPSGVFVASAGGPAHLVEMRRLLRPFLPDQKVEQLGGDDRHFGMQNGSRHLANHFEEVVRHNYDDILAFDTLQPILDYILSEQSLVWDMPLDRLSKFVHHVKDVMNSEGQIRVTVEKGIFVARRRPGG